jgi:hypothetical protein
MNNLMRQATGAPSRLARCDAHLSEKPFSRPPLPRNHAMETEDMLRLSRMPGTPFSTTSPKHILRPFWPCHSCSPPCSSIPFPKQLSDRRARVLLSKPKRTFTFRSARRHLRAVKSRHPSAIEIALAEAIAARLTGPVGRGHSCRPFRVLGCLDQGPPHRQTEPLTILSCLVTAVVSHEPRQHHHQQQHRLQLQERQLLAAVSEARTTSWLSSYHPHGLLTLDISHTSRKAASASPLPATPGRQPTTRTEHARTTPTHPNVRCWVDLSRVLLQGRCLPLQQARAYA